MFPTELAIQETQTANGKSFRLTVTSQVRIYLWWESPEGVVDVACEGHGKFEDTKENS